MHCQFALQDVQFHYVQMALGGWKEELLGLVKTACFDTKVLRKIYFHHDTLTDEHLAKHAKFMLELVSRRAKSIIGTYLKPPWRYAGLLEEGFMSSTLALMVDEWKLLLSAESQVSHGNDIPPLQTLHFLQSSFCRLHFLAAERDNLVQASDSDAILLTKVACQHVGDTVLVENTHQKVKDLLRQARHETSSRMSKFQAVIQSNVFAGRDLPHLKVDDLSKAMAGFGKNKGGVQPVVKSTHPSSHKLNKEYQEVMKYKAGPFTWPSTSQDSLFNEVANLELLLHLGDQFPAQLLQAASITCLVGRPGDVVACEPFGILVMVVAVAQFAFLGWTSEVIGGTGDGEDGIQVALCRSAGAINWHFLDSLDHWLSIPVKPTSLNRFGPILFQQVGEPCPLLLARIKEGLALTAKQCHAVLNHHGVAFTAQMRKMELYHAICAIYLDSEAEIEEALAKSNLNEAAGGDAEAEGEMDSDYEDLLDHVEEDNMNDPDLKAEKAKLKKRKQKAKLDTILLPPERGRGRGRGRRGRGKGKGKGKGRSRGRGALSQVLGLPEDAAEDEAGTPCCFSSTACCRTFITLFWSKRAFSSSRTLSPLF